MKYTILALLNDGKKEAPKYTVEVEHPSELHLRDELSNDYGIPLAVGSTLLVTRIE